MHKLRGALAQVLGWASVGLSWGPLARCGRFLSRCLSTGGSLGSDIWQHRALRDKSPGEGMAHERDRWRLVQPWPGVPTSGRLGAERHSWYRRQRWTGFTWSCFSGGGGLLTRLGAGRPGPVRVEAAHQLGARGWRWWCDLVKPAAPWGGRLTDGQRAGGDGPAALCADAGGESGGPSRACLPVGGRWRVPCLQVIWAVQREHHLFWAGRSSGGAPAWQVGSPRLGPRTERPAFSQARLGCLN